MIQNFNGYPARLCTLAGALALVGLAGCTSTQNSSSTRATVKDTTPASAARMSSQDDHSKMQLPPGWTQADMDACMAAGTPGKMHEKLTKGVGVWRGDQTMWMGPGAEPMKTQCTSTVTAMMDGRYTKCDVSGEMPGMGPFNGMALAGYDNVQQKFVGTWIDNCGTGMWNGTAELSSDGKTMTWTYQGMCPINKKMTTMREVDRFTSDDTMTMEIFMTDPKSGKEYKAIHTDFTRTSGRS